MECLLLALLCFFLICCTLCGYNIIYALLLWLLLLFCYGIYKKYPFPSLIRSAAAGLQEVDRVLISFVLIGMLSAILRTSGTIAFVVYITSRVCTAGFVVPGIFVLCSITSLITGSAFASSATAGVISIVIAQAFGVPSWLSCGAVMSGIYVGDRLSPISSSAVLIAAQTHSDMFDNIGHMLKTSYIPYMAALILYFLLGQFFVTPCSHLVGNMDYSAFSLSVLTLLPVVLIAFCSICRLSSTLTMLIGIVSGAFLAYFLQGASTFDIIKTMFIGYSTESSGMAALLKGGGILSMKTALFSVAISACYIGIFHLTHFLDRIKSICSRLHFSGCLRYILISILASMVACSQTLAIILTNQLLEETISEGSSQRAGMLEDTAVLIPALVPWSTAFLVPAAAIGASLNCIPFSFYIFLVPLLSLCIEHIKLKSIHMACTEQTT